MSQLLLDVTEVRPALLNGKNAAAYLGVSRSTFLTHIAPQLPRVNLTESGSRVAYPLRAIDDWVFSRTVPPTIHDP